MLIGNFDLTCREDVHVTVADLDSPELDLAEMWASLDSDERSRAERFRSALGRRRYIASHGLLRRYLGECVNRSSQDLQFAREGGGKPYLVEHDEAAATHFNMSHSENLLLVGIAGGHRIGVDIERVRVDVDWRALAKRFYSPDEISHLQIMPRDLALLDFFRIWTAKEAVLKGTGQGITVSLSSVEICLADGDRSISVVRIAGDEREAKRWRLEALESHPNFAATVAYEYLMPDPESGVD